ncbi:MAG: NAD(P)H-dependent oxidoreductase [Methylococcales bacterium]|nr:NAD(P)H-dependent oxidoreductase [Methylococcales bacterium]
MSISKQDIIDAFWFRHACKEFDVAKPVSREDFDFILETARLSPSSFGLEPWKFLVVQNPDLREKLRQYTWGGQLQLPTASYVLVALLRKSAFMRYDSPYIQNFMRQVQNLSELACKIRTSILEKFQADDFDLLNSERSMADWSARQTYLPLANMMTAAALIGIDTCPIEGFDQNSLENLLAKELGIDRQGWGVAYLLAFGYRKADPNWPKTRQPIDNIVEWFE